MCEADSEKNYPITSIRLISSIISRKHWLLCLLFFVFFHMESLASPASDGQFTAHSLSQGILNSEIPNQQTGMPLVPDQFYASASKPVEITGFKKKTQFNHIKAQQVQSVM